MTFDPNTAVLDETPKRLAFNPGTAVLEDEYQKRDLIDKAVGMTPEEMSRSGSWVAGGLQQTAKDVFTIPANFFNQAALNFPRSIAKTKGEILPTEAQSGVAQVLNKAAGVAGAVVGLGPKAVGGALNIGSRFLPKAILPAAKMASGKLGQRLASGALAGAAGSASYAPDTLDAKKYWKQIALGTVLGAVFPEVVRAVGKPLQRAAMTSQEKAKAYLNKNAAVYRKILRPTQSDIQNLEIKGRKNIDDYYRLAAEEGLIIKRTPDNKLDVSDAIAQIQSKKVALNEQLSSALSSDTRRQFSLAEVGYKASQDLRKNIKNDTEYKNAVKNLFEYIGDAIEARGNNVTGTELNNFKQGMWSVSYDPLSPNSNKIARKIGFVAKEMIDSAYADKAVKETNSRLAEYLTLETLLNKSAGKVVMGGRIGGYVARGIGAVGGGLAGQAIPIPGVGPAIGTLAGQNIGGKIANAVYSPERITRGLAGKKIRATPGGKVIRKGLGAAQKYVESVSGEAIPLGKRAMQNLRARRLNKSK